jgi:hypothetical protein
MTPLTLAARHLGHAQLGKHFCLLITLRAISG